MQRDGTRPHLGTGTIPARAIRSSQATARLTRARRYIITTPTWHNALGDEVDLDNIDRVYALNILTMVLLRRGLLNYSPEEVLVDPLVQKLREVVLDGRKPNLSDRVRAIGYNVRCWRAKLPYRAPVK